MHSLQPHRLHGGVVQPRDAHAAHEDAGEQSPKPSDSPVADDHQDRRRRAQDAHHQRKQDRGPIVLHRDGQVVGTHPGVVHGPRTYPIHHGTEGQPGEPGATSGPDDPLGQIARRRRRPGSRPRPTAPPDGDRENRPSPDPRPAWLPPGIKGSRFGRILDMTRRRLRMRRREDVSSCRRPSHDRPGIALRQAPIKSAERWVKDRRTEPVFCRSRLRPAIFSPYLSALAVRGDQPHPDRVANQPGDVVDVQRRHQLTAMHLHCLRAQVQLAGDLLVVSPSATSCSTSRWRGVTRSNRPIGSPPTRWR